MRKNGNIVYSLRNYSRLEGNWTKISNDVYQLTNNSEFKVYCYLCMNYNIDCDYAFPSIRYMAKKINMSPTTVQKAINSLEEKGLIAIRQFENKTSKYTNNIYKIYIPIITKNEIEDQQIKEEEEELRKLLQKMDEVSSQCKQIIDGSVFDENAVEKINNRKLANAMKRSRK